MNLAAVPRNGAIAINSAIDRMNTLTLFVRETLRNELDYGTIPGCGPKPILFKPGAEKIATLFGLREHLERLEAVKDWTGEKFGGEPFFAFEYKVTLKNRDGDVVSECVGSCNSREYKYRYRTSRRRCPVCQSETILKSRHQPEFYCWAKKGGCGAKFSIDDPAITAQADGVVLNDRIFDQVNTIDKMAQKRAYVGAVILAANASNYFSVEHSEIETIDADYEPMQQIDMAQTTQRVRVEEASEDDGPIPQERIQRYIRVTGHTWRQVKTICSDKVRDCTSSELSEQETRELLRWLLADYAVRRRRISETVAYGLTTELIRKQPDVMDESLLDKFLVRLDELAERADLSMQAQPDLFAGVSIS